MNRERYILKEGEKYLFTKNQISNTFLKDLNIKSDFLFKYNVENDHMTFNQDYNPSSGPDKTIIDPESLELIDITRNGSMLRNCHYKDPETSRLTVMNWENIKKTNGDLLRDFGDFRREIVFKVLDQIKKISGCQKCIIISTGTKDITSDLDISLYGCSAIVIVNDFLKIMRHIFGMSIFLMFDCNLYADSFYEPISIENFGFESFDREGNAIITKTYRLLNTNGVDRLNQHVWAFVKIFTFTYKYNLEMGRYRRKPIAEMYGVEQTEVFKNNLIEMLDMSTDVILINVINNAFEMFKEHMKIETLSESTRHYKIDRIVDFDIIDDINDNYINNLSAMNDAKKSFVSETNQTLENLSMESSKLKNKMSKCNFYAYESYLTQGAFFHIVVKESKNQKINIRYYEYLDSLIENIADSIKDVNHIEMNKYGGDYPEFNTQEELLNLAVVKSSKYLMRIFMAIECFYNSVLNTPADPKIDILKSIIRDGTNGFFTIEKVIEMKETLTNIRKRLRGNTYSSICNNIREFLHKEGGCNIERTKVLLDEYLVSEFYSKFPEHFTKRKFKELKLMLIYILIVYTSITIKTVYEDVKILDLN